MFDNTEEKITIIEGPPPTFQPVNDGWPQGLNESATIANVAITHLRTFNGPALVERCYRAWHNRQGINLEFRAPDGLVRYAPIVAARFVETNDGQMLALWVRLVEEDVELELGYEDDNDSDDLDAGDHDQPPDDQGPDLGWMR